MRDCQNRCHQIFEPHYPVKLARKFEIGLTKRIVKDFDVVKGDAVAKARSECFYRGFFGSPNAGEALDISGLGVGEHFLSGNQTPDECFAAALDRLRDPSRFNDVYTNSHI